MTAFLSFAAGEPASNLFFNCFHLHISGILPSSCKIAFACSQPALQPLDVIIPEACLSGKFAFTFIELCFLLSKVKSFFRIFTCRWRSLSGLIRF